MPPASRLGGAGAGLLGLLGFLQPSFSPLCLWRLAFNHTAPYQAEQNILMLGVAVPARLVFSQVTCLWDKTHLLGFVNHL